MGRGFWVMWFGGVVAGLAWLCFLGWLAYMVVGWLVTK